MRSNKEANRRLHAVAEAQAGFFTAKQAQNAGFAASSHTYHVQAGHWAREYRGIYRLTGFPAALHPELTRWHLWAMDRAGRAQGVYSYSTALDLYFRPERPPDLHMTTVESLPLETIQNDRF
ncbi:MAG: type IV toxin-antitoxin system AbiEi family antitoxin domain-containing protein [Acidobacteriaceae bacterium]